MTAAERRRVVAEVHAVAGGSERRAVRFTGFPRSSMQYRSTRAVPVALIARIRALAAERPRWGYRWIHRLLVREGWRVNRKRVQRLYRLEGLAVRRRAKRRRSDVPRLVRAPLSGPNERWSLDFVQDTRSAGRHFRCLTILDEYSREALAIHVAHSIPAVAVIAVLEQLRRARGLPAVLVTDNGSEFRSRAFDAWAYSRDVKLEYIQRGKPPQNSFIESFNGTLRDDCLNLHWFLSLERARIMIEAWRQDYNHVRPHSALNEQTPAEFLAAFTPEQRTAQQPERVQ